MSIVRTSKNPFLVWVDKDRSSPNPIVHFSNISKSNPILVPKRHFLICPSNNEKFSILEIRDWKRVKPKLLVLPDRLQLFPLTHLIQWKLLVPASNRNHIVARVKLLRTECQTPNWIFAFLNFKQLAACLVPHDDLTGIHPDGQQLAVWGPVAADAPVRQVMLDYVWLVNAPDAKVLLWNWG